MYSAVKRRRAALAKTSTSRSRTTLESTFITRSILALYTKLLGATCLTHTGREGYLGAGLGRSSWTINNRSDSTALVEYHIGLKSFVSESTAVNVEVRYEAATEAMGDGFLGVHAGFSVFF